MNLTKKGGVHPARVIAGAGRSGTTWILDAIAEANQAKTIFEPLHPDGVSEAGRFCNRYVPEYSLNPALKGFMDNVFSGKLNSIWANYRMRPDRLCFWSKQFSLKKKYKDRPGPDV